MKSLIVVISLIATSFAGCRSKEQAVDERLYELITEYMYEASNEAERKEILEKISDLGQPGRDLMLNDLERCSQDLTRGTQTVLGSAIILGELKKERAKPSLIKLLNSEFPGLRLASGVALCKMGDNHGIDGLLDVLRTSNLYGDKRDALFQLGEYGRPPVIKEIKAILKEEKDPDLKKLGDKAIDKIKRRA